MMKDRKKRIRAACRILSVLLVVGMAWYCSVYWYQVLLVHGDSMLPTFHDLQMVFIQKNPETFEKGDVVAFRCEALSSILIKRIIATPGDTVRIERGTLFVNHEASRVYQEAGLFSYAGLLRYPVSLDAGQYLVIGDNTEKSIDSRYEEVGIVREESFIGKVTGDTGRKEQ